MRRILRPVPLCVLAVLVVTALSLAQRRSSFRAENCTPTGRAPGIRPDYTGTVIPPNIAPLNFRVQEPGTRYRVEIRATHGSGITILSRSPEIHIPRRPWRALLAANRGGDLHWDIHVRQPDGHWRRFEPITNRIAKEEVDGYLTYRKIRPLYNYWTDIGIYQRDLTSFNESVVLQNHQFRVGRKVDNPCMNCHTFCNSRTDRFSIGLRARSFASSTLLAIDGDLTKVGKFGYTSWHPSGRLVAYSLNKVRQFFHAGGEETRDVIDLDSDLVYYVVGSDSASTTAAMADPDRLETYPTWSPDGRWLYFCSAPILWSDRDVAPPERYAEVRYDLRRIRYDLETDTWAEAETVLSSDETGLSILLPRVSPDGKYLLFCMCRYGCFPIYQPGSDLYLMDLESRTYRRLAVNSDRSESWHSWSSNGRWFVFSSKRRDGIFTRSYLSYLDEAGEAHRPFVLPQEDPTFYDSCFKTYSVPEFTTEPVRVSSRELAEAAGTAQPLKVSMPDVSMTRGSINTSPWRPAVPLRE